jgi:hypothetical protein
VSTQIDQVAQAKAAAALNRALIPGALRRLDELHARIERNGREMLLAWDAQSAALRQLAKEIAEVRRLVSTVIGTGTEDAR